MKDRVKKSLILIGVGIVVNILLSIAKLYVGLSSNSITIMLDGANSTLDIVTCFVTLIAFLVLLAPKSKSYPYGLGRSEYLAGFVVAVVAVVLGALFFIRSLNRMAMPEPIYFGWQNCVLISVAVPAKLGLGLFYYFANKKLKSKAISAIMLDSFLDTGITATSVVSFAISSQVEYAVDAIFGMVMSVVIVGFAIKMVVDNIKCIVVGDGAIEEKECIERVANECGYNVKDVVLHDYGTHAKVGKATLLSNCLLQNDKKQDIISNIEKEIHISCGARVEIEIIEENQQ